MLLPLCSFAGTASWQDCVAERCTLPNTDRIAVASALLVAAGILVCLALFVAE